MKKTLMSLIVLFSTLLLANKSFAQNGAIVGGELISVYITDSTYQIFLKLYTTCGTNTSDSIDICFEDSCNNVSFTEKLAKWNGSGGGCTNYSTGCPNIKNTCDSPGSNITGYSSCFYTTIITLPSRCNNWRFYVTINSRTGANNLNNSGNNAFYAEATLNNSFTNYNSSPFFSLSPAIYVQTNQTFTYNNGARDPDNDSIVTKLILPRTGDVGCGTTISDISFSSNTLNLTNNPLPSDSTFSLNSNNGLFTFKPTQPGLHKIVFETTEYRNGIKMGSAMRELPLFVFGSTSSQPIQYSFGLSNISGGYLLNGDTLLACINQNLSFDFYMNSSDTGAELNMQGGINQTSATISFQNQQTDSVFGSFSWTPVDSQVARVTFVAFDSVCRVPAGLSVHYETFTIIPTQPDTPYINITVSPDSNISANTTVTYTASDTGCTIPKYQWMLNGTDINGATNSTYTTSNIIDGDIIACKMLCLNGCSPPPIGDSISNNITMHVSSGIDNIITNENIVIYPNPNNGMFTISVSETVTGGQIEIINAVGQIIFSEAFKASSKKYNINITDVQSGVYTIRLKTKESVHTESFIIN